MSSPALTIPVDAPVVDAATLMEEHHVHRLVVVDPAKGQPIGILSTTDLARAIAER